MNGMMKPVQDHVINGMKRTLFLLPLFLVACGSAAESNDDSNQENTSIELFGNTQGTTYTILVNDPIELSRDEVESVLADFDAALSTYIPNSVISTINNGSSGHYEFQDPQHYFRDCMDESFEMYQITDGMFDPTVYPLVDGWGFMKDIENVPDSSSVDSLRALLGFENGRHFKWEVDSLGKMSSLAITKTTPGSKLDFNAIAQGQAVDVLAALIERKGGENYFVEIGGEIKVHGKNKDGVAWRIGIDKPVDNSNQNNRELQEIIQLKNLAVATSGSYRKFYIKNGEKYSHTLDPKTGYPVNHNLLSATVVAEKCSTADALATAFMVMGMDKGKAFIKNHPELHIEAYFIFTNEKDRLESWYTPGFADLIVKD